MVTDKQNETLQKAIDGLPCKLSKAEYFDGDGDSCIIGHLTKYAEESERSEKYLRRNNNNRITYMPSILARLRHAFGLNQLDVSGLQVDNDNQYATKHARCVGMGDMLGRILKMRKAS